MAESLIIVESPAKARTIKKILGRGCQVLSSMGHVKDLPKSRLGVDVEKGEGNVLPDLRMGSASRSGSLWTRSTSPSRPYGIGVKCPECGEGEMVERASRAGKMFYRCSCYPDCRFASRSLPVAGPCPVCGYPVMTEKIRKGGKTQIVCLRRGCKGKMEEEPVAGTG